MPHKWCLKLKTSLKMLSPYQKWSLSFTFLIVVVTTIYAIFAAGQWRESVKNNLANEKTIIILQRATIVFDRVSVVTFGHVGLTGSDGISISPRWLNVGNTQTKNLRIYTSKLIKTTTDITDPSFEKEANAVLTQNVIGPKMSVEGRADMLMRNDINKMIAHKLNITMWGEATYNDIFEGTKSHITQFCFHIASIGLPAGRLDKGTVTLSLVNCATHNCMDEECYKY